MSFVYDKNYFKEHFGLKNSIHGFFYKKYIEMRNKVIKKEVLKLANSGKFLDVGFGNNNLIRHFKNNFEVFGIDISEYAVKEIQKKYKKENFKVCDITKEEIPFKEKFDVISAINTIEHLENINNVFKKIHDALSKDGLFLVYLPTRSNFLSKLGYKILYDVKEHIFRPSNKEVKEMLKGAGFKLIKEFAASLFPLKIKNKLIINSSCLYFGIFLKEGQK